HAAATSSVGGRIVDLSSAPGMLSFAAAPLPCSDLIHPQRHYTGSIQPHRLGGGAAGGVAGGPEAGEEGGDGDERERLEEDPRIENHANAPAEELAVDDEDEQGGEHQAAERPLWKSGSGRGKPPVRNGRGSGEPNRHAAAVNRLDIQLIATHERHAHEWYPVRFVDQESEQRTVPENSTFVDVEHDGA